ncbi:uncharacterized protein LOC121726380 [Aricia agestis]|uniref:uncharacterized protein LOC121726380 n=1 Tax=Aricia agestis TaxID=91739 RepID=UPI001C2098DE|nr:uncharacterized protein LOC121726380 [Aricia agestis]
MYRSYIPLYLLFIYATSAELEHESPIKSIVQKTLRATARACMSKINATEADLEYLIEDPPFPEKSACIVTCLLERIGIVKNQKYSKVGFITVVAPLVMHSEEKMKHMKTVAENCDKEIPVNESKCQLGNDITTCIFKYAPELHFNKT